MNPTIRITPPRALPATTSGMTKRDPSLLSAVSPQSLLRFKRIIARFARFSTRFLHPSRGGTMATQPVFPNDELVDVFGSKEESEAMVVRGLLESAGIECLV